MQETHSCINDEKKWSDEFDGNLYFSHGTTNFCDAAIFHVGPKKFELIQKINDKNGRILTLKLKLTTISSS